jgi:rhamnulokinase
VAILKYYLAIDIGASSGRHILGWIENGIMKTEEIYRFSNLPDTVGEHLKWNGKRLFQEILNGLKKAGELGKIPYSVGIDTWGVDYALLDENDEVIGEVYCYRDSRTQKTIPLVHNIISAEKLYEKTGIASESFNTIYQLYDDLLTGKMQKAKTFLLFPNYLHFLLTGVKKQEYSIAATTGMVNAKTHSWDEEIIEKLGFKKDLFGEIVKPGMEVGEFSDKIAIKGVCLLFLIIKNS